jgi:hypothetical protein
MTQEDQQLSHQAILREHAAQSALASGYQPGAAMTDEDRRAMTEWALWKWTNIPSLPPPGHSQ